MDLTARETFLAGLVGRPYRAGGQGPEAFDCYHLARSVLDRLDDYQMPALDIEPATTRAQAEAMLDHPERRNWHEAEGPPRDLDLVLMGNTLRRDFHLGVYVVLGSSGSVLHCDRARGVVRSSVPMLRQSGYNYLRFFRRHEP